MLPTATLIYQLIEIHNSSEITVHLIVPSQSDGKYFENILSPFKIGLRILIFEKSQFDIPQELFKEKNGVSEIAYAKIFAPKILPSEVKKVIYLDTDVLILKPLIELYELNFDTSLAAAIDASDGLVGDLSNAFNSGVMVMDLEEMRRKWDNSLLVESFERNVDSHWMDMSILRLLYKNDWYELPTSFNFIINGQQQKYSSEDPLAIIHFAGGPKPWHGKADSIFFVLWTWLSEKAVQVINGENTDSSQYRIFLEYSYPFINEIYHQLQSKPFEYSWRNTRSELAGTQAELAGTQAELAGTQAELARTQAELARTQAELAAILNSRTWRFFNVYRKFR